MSGDFKCKGVIKKTKKHACSVEVEKEEEEKYGNIMLLIDCFSQNTVAFK